MNVPYDAPISYDAALPYDGGVMALRRCWDAAYPPTSPPNWEVVAFYLGGNTPHVWTDSEIERQSARWRLPIFVRSHDGDPLADAHTSITWLVRHGVPRGVTLALDYETRVDATYLATFDRAVTDAGWRVMVYGSRDFVLRNPKPSGGYWVADYTGSPHLYPGSAATQWSGSGPFGGDYDPNLVADSTHIYLPPVHTKLADLAGQVDQLRADLATDLVDILGKVGQAVDPAAVAALVAAQLEITGISTEPGGTVTVTFGPAQPPPV